MSNIIIILYGFVKPRNKFCAVCACASYKNRQFPLFFAPYRARKSTRRRQSRALRGARRRARGNCPFAQNAVHKERTSAKRPPAALFPPRAARGKSLFEERTHVSQTPATAAPSPARSAGEIPVSKKNARQPNGRPLRSPPRAARGKFLFQERTHVGQQAARCALPARSAGKGFFAKRTHGQPNGRPCARGGEVQTRAHSSSDLISINFFASSMTLPSKLDGSGS